MQQDLSRTIRLAARPDAVWSALVDFRRVASWLPIVGEVRELEPLRRYSAVLEDRMGPFALRADLAITVDAHSDERRLVVAASGEDRQVASRISAKLEVTVAEDAAGSVLTATGRYEITGRIATLGAPAIRKKGERVLDEFFANAARDLGARHGPTTEPEAK